MGLERSIVLLKMKQAFAEGLSASGFISDMKAEGLGYRRTTMLADWRSVNEVEKKAGLLRYVRKDYKPTQATIADVAWKLSNEYMYKIRIQSRLRPTEPITERFVNIMQDRPLSPVEIEGLTWSLIGEQSPKRIGEVVSVTAFSAIHRIPE